MNFIRIGMYKTNAEAGCHFRHFLSSRLIHSVKNIRIRSFFGPNAGKYGPEKLRIRTLFT